MSHDDAPVTTSELMLRIAIRSFADRGYEATSMRQIAQDVGVKPASLYNHYPAKEDLLWAIVEDAITELEARQDAAAEADVTPLRALRTFVRVHVRYHATHAQEARIVNARIRVLSSDRYARVLDFRKRYERRLRDLLVGGDADGSFDLVDVKTTTFAILQMGMAISDWYRPDGELDPEELCDRYERHALRLIGVRVPEAPALERLAE